VLKLEKMAWYAQHFSILDSRTLLISITEGVKYSGKLHINEAKISLFDLHSTCSSVEIKMMVLLDKVLDSALA